MLSVVSLLDENFADIVGLNAAYNAFSKELSPHEELYLPQLNLTVEQLFFLSFAQVSNIWQILEVKETNTTIVVFIFQSWCSSGAKEDNEMELNSGHSPKRYRVIGTLSNMREFSSAFQCPTGSRMNPKEQCEIF